MKRAISFVVPCSISIIGIGIIFYSGKSFNKNLNNFINKENKCYRIAAGLSTAESHDFAKGMEKLVKKYSENKICIEVLETQGTQENLEKLENKEAELATAQADILIMGNLPDLKSDKSEKISLENSINNDSAQGVLSLFSDMYQLVVRNDSDINSVSDLKGKLVALPPKTGGQIYSFAFLLKQYNLIGENEQLVKLVEVDDSKEQEALCNGKVDAVFHVRAVGNESIQELLTKKCKGRLVPIDLVGDLKTNNHYLEETKIPKGYYRGDSTDRIPSEDVETVSVPRLLLARKDVEPEVIKQITQILYNYQGELAKKRPLANLANQIITLDKFKYRSVLPIHPGAQAFYDEIEGKRSWIEENSGTIQVILAVVGIIITLSSPIWFWLKQREQKRKNKADDYIREVTALKDEKDCIEALVKYLKAQESNSTEQQTEFQRIVVEKAVKILIKKLEADRDNHRRLISDESWKSFRKTLETTVSAIKRIPKSEEIFSQILKLATHILDKQRKKHWLNQLVFSMSSNIDTDLIKVLNKAKDDTGTPETLQSSQFVQFFQSTRQQIRQDLQAIYDRATTALQEERISQESFQTFNNIWNVAVADVNTYSN